MDKSIRDKFIGYYKPGKDDDDWTGENTWPFLNLPGKGKCHVSQSLNRQVFIGTTEQKTVNSTATSYSKQVWIIYLQKLSLGTQHTFLERK